MNVIDQFDTRAISELSFTRDIEEIQELLQCLTRENYAETIFKLKESMLIKNKRFDDFVISLFLVARSRCRIFDLLGMIVRELDLSVSVSRNIKIGLNVGSIYFIIHLINEQIICDNDFNEFLSIRKTTYPNKIDLREILFDGTKFFNKFTRMIDDDDVESLKNFLIDPTKDKNLQFIATSFFDPYRTKQISMIEYSALRGSIKCFKFLFINGEYFNEKIMKYAIMGGNTDIIQLLEEQKIHIQEHHIKYAIKCHHRELFEWFMDMFNPKSKKLIEYFLKFGFYHGLHFLSGVIEAKRALEFSIQLNNVEHMCEILKSTVANDQYATLLWNPWIKQRDIVIGIATQETESVISGLESVYKFKNYFIDISPSVHEFIHKNFGFNLLKYRYDIMFPDLKVVGYQDFIQFFIDNGFSFNVIDYFEMSPLMYAAQEGCVELMRYLLEIPDININYMTYLGELDALGFAIYNKRYECIEMLLCDPRLELHLMNWYYAQHFCSKNGLFDQIKSCGNQHIFEMLLKHVDFKLTDKEKEKAHEKFPSIPQELIDSVRLRENDDLYDKMEDLVPEEIILD